MSDEKTKELETANGALAVMACAMNSDMEKIADLLHALELSMWVVHAGHSHLLRDCPDMLCVQNRKAIAKAGGKTS